MKRSTRIATLALAATLTTGITLAPLAASASQEGRRNTAIGLGAAAIALLATQKNALPGILTAGAAAYAFSQSGRRDHQYGADDWNRGTPRGDDNGYNHRGNDSRDHGPSLHSNGNSFARDNGQSQHGNGHSNRG